MQKTWLCLELRVSVPRVYPARSLSYGGSSSRLIHHPEAVSLRQADSETPPTFPFGRNLAVGLEVSAGLTPGARPLPCSVAPLLVMAFGALQSHSASWSPLRQGSAHSTPACFWSSAFHLLKSCPSQLESHSLAKSFLILCDARCHFSSASKRLVSES